MEIYVITNLKNGMQYVGQTTKTTEERIYQHKRAKRARYQSPIDKDIIKYGIESFRIDILEKCETLDQLNERECHFIKLLNTRYPNGYNMRDGGKNKGSKPKQPPRYNKHIPANRKLSLEEVLKKLTRTKLYSTQTYDVFLKILLKLMENDNQSIQCTTKELLISIGYTKNSSPTLDQLFEKGYLSVNDTSKRKKIFRFGAYWTEDD